MQHICKVEAFHVSACLCALHILQIEYFTFYILFGGSNSILEQSLEDTPEMKGRKKFKLLLLLHQTTEHSTNIYSKT